MSPLSMRANLAEQSMWSIPVAGQSLSTGKGMNVVNLFSGNHNQGFQGSVGRESSC